MVKQLNITFNDKDFTYMLSVKGDTPWRDFILICVRAKEEMGNELIDWEKRKVR